MTYREVARTLRRLGCQELRRRGGGSHRKWYNPGTHQAATIPDHGNRDMKQGTLRAIVTPLGLDWQAFEDAQR